MLVTCIECGGKISRGAWVCPHCGSRDGGYGSVKIQAEVNKRWKEAQKEEKKQKEIKDRQLAAEKRRAEEQEARRKRQRDDFIVGVVGSIIFIGVIVGVVFGIRHIALEIWHFVSALF